MNEDALRTMIRESIARRLGDATETTEVRTLVLTRHPSHARYALPGSGGACIIEPAVQCNHCGYCQSHGH